MFFTVQNRETALRLAHHLTGNSCEKSVTASLNAGYPVFMTTDDSKGYCSMCDLNTRVECTIQGVSVNIWIREDTEGVSVTYTNSADTRYESREIENNQRRRFMDAFSTYNNCY